MEIRNGTPGWNRDEVVKLDGKMDEDEFYWIMLLFRFDPHVFRPASDIYIRERDHHSRAGVDQEVVNVIYLCRRPS